MDLDVIIYLSILICTAIIGFLPLVKDVKKIEEIAPQRKKAKGRPPAIAFRKKGLFPELTKWGKVLLFFTFLTIGLSVWSKIRDNRNANALTNEVRDLKFVIDSTRDDPAEKVTTGFSLFSILQVGDVPERKRKFIFDCGESISANRLSLFLDFDNNLVFSIIDNSGVTYSVRAVPNFATFKPNATYFLHCSVGYSKDYSFIRIFLDDRQIAMQSFNNKIAGEKLIWRNPTIGCDMERMFCGKFFLSSVLSYQRVFLRKDIIGIMNKMTSI